MHIYIICPVRNLSEKEKQLIDDHVDRLERDGNTVRLPYRDTDQDDEFGLRIVEEHEDDIMWADEIHVWWNPESRGSYWDMAGARMAKRFMPEKRIVLINADSLLVTVNPKDPGKKHKSYTNVLLGVHHGLTVKSTYKDLKQAHKPKIAGEIND